MNVIIMVSSGYPYHFSANNSKGEFIARGLKEAGANVVMMDDLFGTKSVKTLQEGVSDMGIPYVLFPRNGRKFFSFFHIVPMMWNFMKKYKGEEGNHLITGMHQYPFYFVIIFMAWLLGYKRSALFHEWHVGFKNVVFWRKLEANIKDHTFGFFLNIIFPISHFLEKKCSHFHKQTFLLPVLADFSREPRKYAVKDHFAYCCAAEYLLRSPLILDAFEMISKHNEAQLVLILSGYNWKKKEIDNLLSKYRCHDNFVIKTQLPQEELYEIYDSSIALLLPLDPTSIQDQARFSQKIAEYVSTKRPVITNAVGEIPYYFQDKISAMMVDYTAMGFFSAMEELLQNEDLGYRIGDGGFQVGMENFDYRKVGLKLKTAIKNI